MPSHHQSTTHGWPQPLVERLLDEGLAAAAATPVIGVSGLQGTGKSTLAAQLSQAGAARGLCVATLSIDDVYLDRPERERLAAEVHPLLATRGPPGTHDLALAADVLDGLRASATPPAIPRFDKLRDRRLPASAWTRLPARPDVVVFEGWFLGTPPEPPEALGPPVNALERDEDPDGRWRRYCNAALARYQPLWRRIDRLVFLAPPGFEVVPRWRMQQERALAAADPGARPMDEAALLRFVQHYERVSRQALRTLPALADRVIRIDVHREVREEE
ncbi:kinase [Coralloluteibacterium thermophilus]|uniref:Kinase n=1 Tax=Coralloluteibacterium thermophilum TaxID=2707049 RepID=A0ABV9NJ91_9GAMM